MTPREALSKCDYFNLSENWGDIDKVHPDLILSLDDWRRELGSSVIISPVIGAVYANGIGHSNTSWHYIIEGRNKYAMAADIFPTGDLLSAWILAAKYFNGIGIYPEWKLETRRGNIIYGGLHVDIRTDKRQQWVQLYGDYYNVTPDNVAKIVNKLQSIR